MTKLIFIKKWEIITNRSKFSTGGSLFGFSVAIQGSTIVVGDSGDEKLIFFQKVGNHYKPIQVLTGGSNFGYSVAIQGSTIVVGDSGTANSAYIYQLQS